MTAIVTDMNFIQGNNNTRIFDYIFQYFRLALVRCRECETDSKETKSRPMRGISFRKLNFLAVFVSLLAPLNLNADERASSSHNCFDKVCFGPVHVFIEGASETEVRNILNLSCRLTGITLTPALISDFQEEDSWPNYRNLVLFVDDLAISTRIHPILVRPSDIPAKATRFGGTLSVNSNNRIYSTEFLAFDQFKTGCDDWECWIGVTYQFLELVYDQQVLVDQEKYGEGAYCVDD